MNSSREQELMTRLSLVQRVSLAEAMELLSISESTARRLFAKLEQNGFAIRTHGGIQSVSRAMTRYSFEYGTKTNTEISVRIYRNTYEGTDDTGSSFPEDNGDTE